MEQKAEFSRRKALTRMAAAGAVAWSAPMIVSSTAHAAGSLRDNVCADIGRPTTLTYQFVGGTFDWDICIDPNTGPMQDLRSPTSGIGANPPCVDVNWSGPNATGTAQGLTVGSTFTITGLKPGNPNVVFIITPCNQPSPSASMTVHTSCSQALCVGDKHGYFVVTGYT